MSNRQKTLLASQLLFYFFGGLGIFFLGIGVLWFVSVYKDKGKEKKIKKEAEY